MGVKLQQIEKMKKKFFRSFSRKRNEPVSKRRLGYNYEMPEKCLD
jgi:hypothetical protein